MVNSGRVRYTPTSKNASLDYIVFDVTNGITGAKGLHFYFQVN